MICIIQMAARQLRLDRRKKLQVMDQPVEPFWSGVAS